MVGFDIDSLRTVEWGATYLWDIRIPSVNVDPFIGWFPATNVREPLINPVLETIDYSTMKVQVPKTTSSLDMVISFYDDVNRTLEKWLLAWHNSIYNDYMHVTPLWDCVRDIYVLRLDRQRERIAETVYSCFPSSKIDIESDSGAKARQINLTLEVAGYRRVFEK